MATSGEARIPFVAAAQQLDSTVRRAIFFFDNFYQDFRNNSDGHRQHADKKLMDSLWQSKIKGSSSHPTRKYDKKDRKGDDHNTNDDNNGQANYDTSSAEKKPPTPPDELFSFRELQQQVIHRVEQLMRSKKPVLPSIAPSYDSSDGDNDYFDDELDQQQRKHYAAETLKEDIQHDYMGLKRAVEGMSTDHMQAKTAIRKLKIVKQYLLTYRIAWNDRYEDNGGEDSDEEDEKRGMTENI
jgi:hypothetical protein